MPFCPTVNHRYISPFDETHFAQALLKSTEELGERARRAAAEEADQRECRLLRARRERPRRRATEQGDDLAAFQKLHSGPLRTMSSISDWRGAVSSFVA